MGTCLNQCRAGGISAWCQHTRTISVWFSFMVHPFFVLSDRWAPDPDLGKCRKLNVGLRCLSGCQVPFTDLSQLFWLLSTVGGKWTPGEFRNEDCFRPRKVCCSHISWVKNHLSLETLSNSFLGHTQESATKIIWTSTCDVVTQRMKPEAHWSRAFRHLKPTSQKEPRTCPVFGFVNGQGYEAVPKTNYSNEILRSRSNHSCLTFDILCLCCVSQKRLGKVSDKCVKWPREVHRLWDFLNTGEQDLFVIIWWGASEVHSQDATEISSTSTPLPSK